MGKKILQEEINSILQAIKGFPEGASLSDVFGALKMPLPRRRVQYRLICLSDAKVIIAEGKTRNRRYRLREVQGLPGTQRKDSLLLLSTTAESILEIVSQPIQKRAYVSYEREFLDAYRPNGTQYLSTNARKELLELGKTDGERPAGTYARSILHRLLIDLSWNSSRLEGNTYSLLETERLLELGQAIEGRDAKEAQMILNHKSAIEFLVDTAEEIQINRHTILNLHAMLSDNLLPDPRACGRLRSIGVGIAKSVYRPLEVPQLITECFNQIIDSAQAIIDPFEQAFFLMVHLPYLQPFEDVNKRVSRLAANIPLIRQNLCPLSFVDVPEDLYIGGLLGVYELNRIDLLREVFIWAYKRSCSQYSATRKSLGEPDIFRMRYRQLIAETVSEVVLGCMNRQTAAQAIKTKSLTAVPIHDQAHFVEVVETEVLALHEGNIARYRLRPLEYENWQKFWRGYSVR